MLHLGGKILTMTDGVVSLLNRASATHALLDASRWRETRTSQ